MWRCGLRQAGLAAVMVACASPAKVDTSDSGEPVVARPDTASTVGPPATPVVAIEPSSPQTLDDLELVVAPSLDSAADESLTRFVAWFQDGVPVADLEDRVPADLTTKGEVWEVRVAVSDGMFTSETAVSVVVIGNTPPDALVSLTPVSATTESVLEATVGGTDVDADALGYRIRWLRDGADTGWSDFQVQPAQTTRGEEWTVEVVAVDDVDASEPAVASISIDNALPRVDSVDLGPSSPRTTEPVEVRFAASDPDGDELTAEITWYVDGDAVSTGPDTTLPAAATARGQVIEAAVAVSDGWVTGTPRYSAALVVENTPPTIVSAALSPADPAVDDSVVCVPGGWADDDGDAPGYTYSWTVDGAEVSTSASVDLALQGVQPGAVLGCAVTPTDGIDDGVSVSVSAVVTDE